ncbi:MAG: LysM peptidoglycan-binding domain-containing protein [Planctomycetaceae bacterium]|nr:LysM peptidoglycan-binding domain-containing protein [Planctomycetaceae bacterium]
MKKLKALKIFGIVIVVCFAFFGVYKLFKPAPVIDIPQGDVEYLRNLGLGVALDGKATDTGVSPLFGAVEGILPLDSTGGNHSQIPPVNFGNDSAPPFDSGANQAPPFIQQSATNANTNANANNNANDSTGNAPLWNPTPNVVPPLFSNTPPAALQNPVQDSAQNVLQNSADNILPNTDPAIPPSTSTSSLPSVPLTSVPNSGVSSSGELLSSTPPSYHLASADSSPHLPSSSNVPPPQPAPSLPNEPAAKVATSSSQYGSQYHAPPIAIPAQLLTNNNQNQAEQKQADNTPKIPTTPPSPNITENNTPIQPTEFPFGTSAPANPVNPVNPANQGTLNTNKDEIWNRSTQTPDQLNQPNQPTPFLSLPSTPPSSMSAVVAPPAQNVNSQSLPTGTELDGQANSNPSQTNSVGQINIAGNNSGAVLQSPPNNSNNVAPSIASYVAPPVVRSEVPHVHGQNFASNVAGYDPHVLVTNNQQEKFAPNLFTPTSLTNQQLSSSASALSAPALSAPASSNPPQNYLSNSSNTLPTATSTTSSTTASTTTQSSTTTPPSIPQSQPPLSTPPIALYPSDPDYYSSAVPISVRSAGAVEAVTVVRDAPQNLSDSDADVRKNITLSDPLYSTSSATTYTMPTYSPSHSPQQFGDVDNLDNNQNRIRLLPIVVEPQPLPAQRESQSTSNRYTTNNNNSQNNNPQQTPTKENQSNTNSTNDSSNLWDGYLKMTSKSNEAILSPDKNITDNIAPRIAFAQGESNVGDSPVASGNQTSAMPPQSLLNNSNSVSLANTRNTPNTQNAQNNSGILSIPNGAITNENRDGVIATTSINYTIAGLNPNNNLIKSEYSENTRINSRPGNEFTNDGIAKNPERNDNIAGEIPAIPFVSPPIEPHPVMVTTDLTSENLLQNYNLNNYRNNKSQASQVRESTTNLVTEQIRQFNTGEHHKMHNAFIQLAKLYGRSDLSDVERDYVAPTLDRLALELIYSSQHHVLEPPYRVKAGDTIESIAKQFNISPELLCKINGLNRTEQLATGNELKVILGQFDAKIHTKRGELTLLLGGLYAGRFPVVIGRGIVNVKGEFLIKSKAIIKSTKILTLTNGITLTGLDKQISQDSLGVSQENIEELFDILTEKSVIVITD